MPAHDPTPVLYRGKGLPFSEADLQRLKENYIQRVYIESGEEEEFHGYVEENLASILSDKGLKTDSKAQMLYGSAQRLMKQVMEDPRAGEAIPRSKRMVENTMEFMAKDNKAFQNIVKVVSYDYYTYTHSVNVFVFSMALLQELGISKDQDIARDFGYGALLHDVGKSMIDPAILNCPGKLSKEQWEEMRLHPIHGHDILVEQGSLQDIALDASRHHHEKLHGKGYPDGLSGDQVSPWARICAIADIFDALTTNRSYKSATPSFDALKLMRDEMSEELDQEYFGVFVKLMGSQRR